VNFETVNVLIALSRNAASQIKLKDQGREIYIFRIITSLRCDHHVIIFYFIRCERYQWT